MNDKIIPLDNAATSAPSVESTMLSLSHECTVLLADIKELLITLPERSVNAFEVLIEKHEGPAPGAAEGDPEAERLAGALVGQSPLAPSVPLAPSPVKVGHNVKIW